MTACRRYCWSVSSIDDLEIAPFHLLASEGAVPVERDHGWHMATLARLAAADPALLSATPCQEVVLGDEESERAGVAWWSALTEAGGEGMIVKPLSWLARGARGLAQPAIKCRGREYLRIIYGPEYTLPEQLDRLRARNVKAKRSLAIREYASASRRCTASSSATRGTAYASACLPCSRSRASRSIRGCSDSPSTTSSLVPPPSGSRSARVFHFNIPQPLREDFWG